MPPPNLMFTLFRARNQTVECYIDHYYGRPAIASPAPLLRHAGVHRPHLDAARSTGSPRRARIAGPTAQRLLRSNTKSAQLLPASCRRNLRPLPATIHHIPQPTYPITHVTSSFPELSHLTP